MSRRWEWLAITLILLLAALFTGERWAVLDATGQPVSDRIVLPAAE